MRADRLWTLDVGNSRAKVREWRLREGLVSAPLGDWPLDELVRVLRERLRAEAGNSSALVVAYSCVAAKELESEFSNLLSERLGEDFLGSPDSGLENQCRPREGVGRDRLFAARGAYERSGASAIVVDVGTAMTVDALVVADRPYFAGGAIAPGPSLLAAALHSATARLPLVTPTHDATALGLDTTSAIAAGIRHGVRGAAKELVERVAEEASIAAAPVFLAGGASQWLMGNDLFGRRALHVEPELVHVGLLCAALDRLRGSETAQRYAAPRP